MTKKVPCKVRFLQKMVPLNVGAYAAASFGYNSTCLPNLLYMLVSTIYHLGLAVWIGGAIALGALTAPELFRQLPRAQAGGVFGTVLRRFSRLRLAAILITTAAAGVKHVAWESHASNIWIILRWSCLALLTVIVAAEVFILEPALETSRRGMIAGSTTMEGQRARFSRLHSFSERLMKVSLAVALLAVFLG